MSTLPPTETNRFDSVAPPLLDISEDASVDLSDVLEQSQVMEVLQKLDQELVGLKLLASRVFAEDLPDEEQHSDTSQAAGMSDGPEARA
ncbi:MAG: hypothetical protein ACJ8CB_04595 [Ktedonobacteraceae bacterium]